MRKTLMMVVGLALVGSFVEVRPCEAFGGRRRQAQNYVEPAAPTAATAPAPATNFVQPTAQVYRTPTSPRTQGPCYAYPNTDPRRFNFQYNH